VLHRFILSFFYINHTSTGPWTGNCVGERNYHFFFSFVVSLSGLLILSVAMSIRVLIATFEEAAIHDAQLKANSTETLNYSDLGSMAEYGEETANRFWSVFREQPLTCTFGAYLFLCAWTLLSLLWYHVVLISIAQTTNERVRDVYRHGAVVNAADKGCCRNWCNFLCQRQRPTSRIPADFSAFVDTDRSRCEHPWQPPATIPSPTPVV
jgi:DHHC palmitoyltransferase